MRLTPTAWAHVALAVGAALLLAGLACSLFTALAIEWRRVLESDCAALCESRQSARRHTGAFGCVCHDGTVWHRE